MTESVVVEPCGRQWAIKHKGSFLGYADSQEQAARLADHLQAYLAGEGRAGDLRIERRQLGDGGHVSIGRAPSTTSKAPRNARHDGRFLSPPDAGERHGRPSDDAGSPRAISQTPVP